LKFFLAQDEDQSMKRKRFTEEQIIRVWKEHEERTSSPPYPFGEHHFWLGEWQIEKRRNSFIIRDFSANQDKAKEGVLDRLHGRGF
jgi:hypothetical protein